MFNMELAIQRFKMPFTVITLKSSPPSLRGDLTKWMQEIATGVYVGNFNKKVREELWERVVESLGPGETTMTYAFRNEIGYKFETHNSGKLTIDADGIPLVLTPNKIEKTQGQDKHGFSKEAKFRKAKKYTEAREKKKEEYIVLDLETTGLNPLEDSILEIGAIKKAKNIEEFHTMIQYKGELKREIRELTGIRAEELEKGEEEKIAIEELLDFIEDRPILGYNIDFDIKFINEALKKQGLDKIRNKTYDIMKYVKREKLFLKNYQLQTVIKEYGMEEKVPHRALEDAKIIQVLAEKVKGLMEKLK